MNLRLTPAPSEPAPPVGASEDDAHLMDRIATGDMTAFAVLITRHQQHVRRLAHRITGAADAADDITQESFLRVLRGARSYRPSAAFTTFLHRIVVNLCLDRAKRPKLARLPDDRAGGTGTPDAVLSHEERHHAIRAAIQSLPDRQRIAVLLHRFEGLSHAAIARVTGWSESAIEALLVRAYAQLRVELKRWEN